VRASANLEKQNLAAFGTQSTSTNLNQTVGSNQQNQTMTAEQIKNMAAPATSMGLHEILSNPALQTHMPTHGSKH